jgi:hypothetical protein
MLKWVIYRGIKMINGFEKINAKWIWKHTLNYVVFWYLGWTIFSVLVLIVYLHGLIFGGHDLQSVLYKMFSCMLLLVNSFLYLKIGRLVRDNIYTPDPEIGWKRKVSTFLFVLFGLRLILFFVGNSERGSVLLRIKELLPPGNLISDFYDSIYLYIPAIFDFFKPRLNGVTTLIMAILFFCLDLRDHNEGDSER